MRPWGRPNRFPCWRTRSGPANTSAELYVLLLPIWIMTRPIGVGESMPRSITIQADAGSTEFGQGVRHVQDASTKPVGRPYHQDIKPTPYRVLEHLVEAGGRSRPLAPLMPWSSYVWTIAQATMLSDLGENEPLVLCGLIVSADAQIDRCANAVWLFGPRGGW